MQIVASTKARHFEGHSNHEAFGSGKGRLKPTIGRRTFQMTRGLSSAYKKTLVLRTCVYMPRKLRSGLGFPTFLWPALIWWWSRLQWTKTINERSCLKAKERQSVPHQMVADFEVSTGVTILDCSGRDASWGMKAIIMKKMLLALAKVCDTTCGGELCTHKTALCPIRAASALEAFGAPRIAGFGRKHLWAKRASD